MPSAQGHITVRRKAKDGTSGTSPLVFDLDNEMECFATNPDGTLVSDLDLRIQTRLYEGVTHLSDFTLSTNVSYLGDLAVEVSNVRKQVRITGNAGQSMGADTRQLEITASIGGVTRKAIFTLTAAKGGANGDPATIYRILCSPSQATFQRTESGALTPSNRTIEVNVQKVVGSNITELTPSQARSEGLTLTYNAAKATTTSDPVPDTGINVSSSIESMNIGLFLGDTVLDMETIPVIKDGAKGENGIDYDLSARPTTIVKHEDGTLSASSVTCQLIKKLSDGSAVPQTSLPTGYTMRGGKDGTVTVSTGVPVTVSGITSANSYVFFELLYNGKVVENLTVSIIAEGGQGEEGISLKSTDSRFKVTTSNTPPSCTAEEFADTSVWKSQDAAASEWSDTNKYMWQAMKMSYYRGSIRVQDEYIVSPSGVFGEQGKAAVHLDLTNQMDSIMYDGSGTQISSNATSTAVLYEGDKKVTSGVVFSKLNQSGCSAYVTEAGTITVSGMTANSGYVIVRATYKGNTYDAKFSVVKLVGTDKYELSISPSQIGYNTSTGQASASSIVIEVYKTPQNGSRALLQSLPNNVKLFIDGEDYSSGYSSKYTISSIDYSKSSYEFVLKDGDTILDIESVPITKSENGNGTDGTTYWLMPSVDEILRYRTGELSVSTITCAKMKQTGDGSPQTASDATLSYTYNNGGTETTEPSYNGTSTIKVGIWWSKIVFTLKKGATTIATKTILVKDATASVGDNILNGTNFVDEPDSHTKFASNKELVDGVSGHKALRCENDVKASSYIDFFKQDIINGSDIRVQSNTWYTLSFWAKSEGYTHLSEGITSPEYGFAAEEVYLNAGAVNVLFSGYISSETSNAGRELRVFIYKEDWSWSANAAIKSTTTAFGTLNATIPESGIYKIKSYVYPNATAVASQTATINWYRVYRRDVLSTFVYPSLISTSQLQVANGIINSSKPSDGYNVVNLTQSWKRYSFVFKTKGQLPTAVQHVLFRLPEGTNPVQICMPKLEQGVFPTDWCRSERDKQGLTYILICNDSIQEDSTGCDIKILMSYGEQSKLLTYAEANERGLAVTGTGVQWNSSYQRLYVSSGVSAGATYTVSLTLNSVVIGQKVITVTPKGEQGLAGCIQRITEWVEGVEYHNDESMTTGTRYLDTVIETTGLITFNAFKCKLTHTSTGSSGSAPLRDSNGNINTTHWQQLNNTLPIYTPMMLAAYGMIRFAQTNQLLVMKADGTTVAAGMGGGNYPIWAGATSPEQAPFRVGIDGIMRAVGAELFGKVVSGVENGQRLELDPNTKSMTIYDNSGDSVCIFEGNSYTDIINLFSNESGNFTMNSNRNGSISEIKGDDITDENYSVTKQISSAVHTSTPTAINVKGTVQVYAESARNIISTGLQRQQYAIVYVLVRVITYSDSDLTNVISEKLVKRVSASAVAFDTIGTKDEMQVAIDTEVKVVAGYHVIELSVISTIYGKKSKCWAKWGTKCTKRSPTPTAFSASYKCDFYVSRFYANGFVLGISATNYVCAYNGTSDGMHFIAENDGYGFQLSKTGIKIKLQGDSAGWRTITRDSNGFLKA